VIFLITATLHCGSSWILMLSFNLFKLEKVLVQDLKMPN